MKRTTVTRAGGVALLVAALALAPVFKSGYVLQQLEEILALVMVAIGLNVVTGYAGQLTLGPGATFAAAGFTTAVFANWYPSELGLAPLCGIGIIAAVLVGVVVGMPSLRIGGFYLAMVTLFAALLIPTIAGNLNVTGQSNGISLVSNIDFYQHPGGTGLYELSVALVLLVTLGSYGLLHSKLGHRFLILRTSEELAVSLGISGYWTKLVAFMVSSVPSGIAGALYVYTQQFISPGSITTSTSIYLLAACVIGGFGTVIGPIVGGLLVLGFSEFSGGLAEYQGIIFGGILLGFSILLPEGLLGVRSRLPGIRPALDHALGSIGIRMPAPHRIPVDALAGTVGPSAVTTSSVVRPPDEHSVLTLEGVTRRFGGVTAVDDVSLELPQGTTIGLIGSNGSGKTTVLNLISGFYRMDAGSLAIDGQPLDQRRRHAMAGHGIARTFQTPMLVDELTVVENVAHAAETVIAGTSLGSFLRTPGGRRLRHESVAAAHDCLGLVGLAAVAEVRCGDLPHGLRRLVEVARALALKPRFALLDEPAAGLSMAEIDHLRTTLRVLNDANVGVLLVEHNIPLVLDVCGRVTVLHLGQVIAEGPPARVIEDEQVAMAFLGKAGV